MSLIDSNWLPIITVTADFNGDDILDISIAYTLDVDIHILLGYGNGSFVEYTVLSVENCSNLMEVFVADFNSDNYPDIAITCLIESFISVFFGDGNRAFSRNIILDTGTYSYTSSIAVANFNNDTFLDIVVVNRQRNLGVFLGHGNGSFDIQKISFAGGRTYPLYIAAGDFNEDVKQDVVFSYFGTSTIGVMFGYGNGTFGEKIKFMLNAGNTDHPIIVSDFNNDQHLDIAAFTLSPYTINIFFGDGHEILKCVAYIQVNQMMKILV